MTICERMFDIMEKRGVTAYVLAQKTGLSNSTLSNWRTRNTDPPSKYIVPICEAIGCSVEYLLTGADTGETSSLNVTCDELEMLDLYRRMSKRDQLLLLGHLQEIDHPLLESKQMSQQDDL